MSLSR
jgi:hypothetical protein